MNYYLVLPLVEVVLSLILLPIVVVGRLNSRLHGLFGLYLLGLLVYGLLIFLMRSSLDTTRAFFWEQWLFGMGSLMGVVFYHFTIAFSGADVKKWFMPLLYALAIVFFIFSRMDLIAVGMQVKSYGYAPIPGPLIPIYGIFIYSFSTASLVNLIRQARNSPYSDERKRGVYITIGWIASMVGGMMDLLPLLGLPLYPGFIIGTTIFCLLTTFAIIRYSLLDIRIVIRRGMAYFMTSTLIAIPFVGILFAFDHIVGDTVHPLWGYLLLLAAFALSLQPLWRRVQGLVDRFFYRERYDFLKELEGFSQDTHHVTDLRQISSSLVKLLSRALQATNVYLFLPTASGDFSVAAFVGEIISQLTLNSHSPLLHALHSERLLLHREDMDALPQLLSLTQRELAELDKVQAELIVPIRTKEKELVGFLVLGEKLSRHPYYEEDQRMVVVVAQRMAVELDNARLYDMERAMRRELQKQNTQKTEFLHSVAHELKTPLTAIISSAELLEAEMAATGSGPLLRLIRNLGQSSWAMDRRITELLEYARMEIGAVVLKRQLLDIGAAVEEMGARFALLFKNKGQTFEVRVEKGLPKVMADRDRLEQVVTNLISNANKFSPADSNIIMRVQKDPDRTDRVVIAVDDSAPVIPEEDRKRLFEPYYRGEDVAKRQRLPGLGLGLAIARKLVELHQGKIWIETEPGRGNTFAFWLPASDKNAEEGKVAHLSPPVGGKVESSNH